MVELLERAEQKLGDDGKLRVNGWVFEASIGQGSFGEVAFARQEQQQDRVGVRNACTQVSPQSFSAEQACADISS